MVELKVLTLIVTGFGTPCYLVLQPVEELVAGYMFELLSKMELINEMENYLYLYEAVQSESLSGRKVSGKLQELVGGKLELSPKRLDMLM